MSQMTFGDSEYQVKRKQTRREIFLAEMEQVVPWDSLLRLIEPFYPVAGRGRHPYPIATMLRVHLLQNWFGLSDPAMEEALYEIASMRQFARLTLTGPIPDATIIAAPSSTKNADGKRDPEMHQTKKGNQWYFGMKAHIGADVDSGLVHTVVTTAANEADVEVVEELLHGKEEVVHADAGYTGADKRAERKKLRWEIAAKRGKLRAMKEGRDKSRAEKRETRKASIRAKVEHPFRVIKRQFGLVKVRFRGLAKNTAHVITLFALSNLWMARRQLMAIGAVRPPSA